MRKKSRPHTLSRSVFIALFANCHCKSSSA
jgi:hypothetical protein